MFGAAVSTGLLFGLKWAAGSARCVTMLRFDRRTSGDLLKRAAGQNSHTQIQTLGGRRMLCMTHCWIETQVSGCQGSSGAARHVWPCVCVGGFLSGVSPCHLSSL